MPSLPSLFVSTGTVLLIRVWLIYNFCYVQWSCLTWIINEWPLWSLPLSSTITPFVNHALSSCLTAFVDCEKRIFEYYCPYYIFTDGSISPYCALYLSTFIGVLFIWGKGPHLGLFDNIEVRLGSPVSTGVDCDFNKTRLMSWLVSMNF